jgi:hypothetical protein
MLKYIEKNLGVIVTQNIVTFLQSMSFAQAGTIVPLVLGLIVFVLPWIRDKLGLKLSSEVNDGFFDGFSAMALFFVFIGATSLSIVLGFQNAGAKAVEIELNQIVSLDRELSRHHNPEIKEAKIYLKKYVKAIIDIEWPLLAIGEKSLVVDNIFNNIIEQIDKINTLTLKDEMIVEKINKTLDAVSDARSDRLEVANLHLSPIYWGLVLGYILLMIFISAFTHVSLGKRFAVCCRMIVIAILLVMLTQIDGVFSGEISIKPTEYDKLEKKM